MKLVKALPDRRSGAGTQLTSCLLLGLGQAQITLDMLKLHNALILPHDDDDDVDGRLAGLKYCSRWM